MPATLPAVTLAAATAVLAAPGASVDVGDVDLTFYNAYRVVDGTDRDVFANLTDETMTVDTSCSDTDWMVVGPLDTIHFSTGSDSVIDIIAPAGL